MMDIFFRLRILIKTAFEDRRNLGLENLALRQQLAVLKRTQKRLPLQKKDRLFWAWLSHFWSRWRDCLLIVRPETLVAWHRQSFRP
jgi:putative transposase